MKKPASKVAEPAAQIQPKSQFLFHKNLPPRDFSLMTLVLNSKTKNISKCLDFQKKLIAIITTSKLYLKFKENNENDMAAQVFGFFFFIPVDVRAKSAQQL